MSEPADEWRRDKAEFIAHQDEVHPVAGPDQSPLARQFARLTRSLMSERTVAGVLSTIAGALAEVVPAGHLVSVTLLAPDGRLHTPAGTDPLGVELDRLQERFDEGPCLEAARTPGLAYTYSGDLANDRNWTRFGPAAADLGFRSVLSTAMPRDTTPRRLAGALNVYSRRAGALGEQIDRDRALLLATHASLAVAQTEAVHRAELVQTQLRQALDTRDVIGQAKGILMHSRGISADEAFELLRRTSQDLNIKLAELARTLATHHTELEPRDPDRTVR